MTFVLTPLGPSLGRLRTADADHDDRSPRHPTRSGPWASSFSLVSEARDQ